MSDLEREKAAIVDELEGERYTHTALRERVADRHDCSEAAVSRAISALHDAGTITHEQGFFELADD
ncbi:hypothetical protein NP511_13660 [Natrinema thermotolerans]|uniref:Uncharacterized protein n=1 Tax=Natrinema thermotolerans TaxID=121872 RepID=A0AAF0P8G7_9EURY|nr:hypothetical protein [Natrinema thermotolerans]QCC59457.1 hypothetical protein DVR14_12790 [Natrinema thermotolerans]WMT06430.1 hypothetical protein NP511_13660 [Natrinema thermotolerans]